MEKQSPPCFTGSRVRFTGTGLFSVRKRRPPRPHLVRVGGRGGNRLPRRPPPRVPSAPWTHVVFSRLHSSDEIFITRLCHLRVCLSSHHDRLLLLPELQQLAHPFPIPSALLLSSYRLCVPFSFFFFFNLYAIPLI